MPKVPQIPKEADQFEQDLREETKWGGTVMDSYIWRGEEKAIQNQIVTLTDGQDFSIV